MELNIEYILEAYRNTVAGLIQENIILSSKVRVLEETIASAKKEE